MTPNDIQVGKFYLRSDYPGSRYLGVGKREPFTYGADMQFLEKHIICVKTDYPYGVGLIFKTPEDDCGSSLREWSLFYLDPDQNP